MKSAFQPLILETRLLYSGPKALQSRTIVYLLPVEKVGDHRYGDGLEEVRKLNLCTRYDVVFAESDFAQTPWFADHPSDPGIRQESYFIKSVCPQVEETLGWSGAPVKRYLVGFSKSGWGALVLLLRHPDMFAGASCWDAPLLKDLPNAYGMDEIFGTADNFRFYQFTRLVTANSRLLANKRVALSGYSLFRSEMIGADHLLSQGGVAHTFRDGPMREHRWGSGWLEGSVSELLQTRNPN